MRVLWVTLTPAKTVWRNSTRAEGDDSGFAVEIGSTEIQTYGRHGMLVCVRTTLNLPDGLVEAAKIRAAAEGRTFTSLVEAGLRSVLESETTVDAVVTLPSYGRPGGEMLVDIDDRDAIWAALDAE